jgi:hypothetical protein
VIPAHTWLLARAAGYRFEPAPDGSLLIRVDEISNPIRAVPDAPCAAPEDVPAAAIVWQAIADHYPDPPADWAARRDWPLPQMLDGLGYPTLTLVTGAAAYQPAPGPDWRDEIPRFVAVANRRLAAPGSIAELGLTHGLIGSDIAYIRLDAVQAGRSWGTGPDLRARAGAEALAQSYADAAGVILDLRWAAGGNDRSALGYAAVFGGGDRLIGIRQVTTGPGRLGPADPLQVRPGPGPRFTQPVIVLISQHTAGAAEILARALAPLPNVTVIGEPTAGAPSDLMLRALPGGGLLALPHQVHTGADGNPWDGTGLQPDVLIPVDPAAFTASTDPMLDAARDALR